MWSRVVGGPSHAAPRAPSTRLSHSAIWFQLVKIWLAVADRSWVTPQWLSIYGRAVAAAVGVAIHGLVAIVSFWR